MNFLDGRFKKEQKNNVVQSTVVKHQTSNEIPREPTISDFAMVSAVSFQICAV